MDIAGGIIKYENGEMDRVETVEFFQSLVNTGLAWTLQGHYGRTAMGLIHEGLVALEPAPYPDYEGSYIMQDTEETEDE
jgi:hypothetical protein